MFRVLVTGVPPESVTTSSAAPPQNYNLLSGSRVLVVDDEESIREGMRQTLAAWGCVPLIAENADEAVALCVGGAVPEAMVVDFRLPGGHDGITAVAMLRSSFGRSVPALIVSGESSSEELARIERSGLMLLHKPIAPARLRAALSYLLTQVVMTEQH
jgi:CheY-like chemotaxis protein